MKNLSNIRDSSRRADYSISVHVVEIWVGRERNGSRGEGPAQTRAKGLEYGFKDWVLS